MKLPRDWLARNYLVIAGLLTSLALVLIVCCTIQNVCNSPVESFQPGPFPDAVTSGILSDWYGEKKYEGLQPTSYGKNSANYPIFPAAHCGTNNIRLWDLPTNGTCAPAEICTQLYKRTDQDIANKSKASMPRVNYYFSDSN